MYCHCCKGEIEEKIYRYFSHLNKTGDDIRINQPNIYHLALATTIHKFRVYSLRKTIVTFQFLRHMNFIRG